ncbi:TonB-dependent receptor [Brevundimonas faecalis]|uniref:Iron complex outermembrane receptor protein n=1 Tax=Brevundimonas faecalis TaxID=947378 RepID=A0ABV2RET7_9CAUL
MTFSVRAACLASASFAVLGLAAPVLAADDERAADGAIQVSEIVVTAQRKEQPLAAAPLSLTVATQPLLNDAGVRDIKDLQILTPGLVVASTSNQTFTTARIRGVGTVGDNPGLESSVGVMIDGVYRPRNGAALGDLGEVERIEVLKGPQSTLFGKNTSAGVINVVTAVPSFTPRMTGEATVGEHGTRGGSVSLTGPILDEVLAGRLYVAARRRDGLYSVRTGDGPRTADDDQNEDYDTVRGQLLWRATPRLTARLTADWTARDERCCVGVQLITGSTAALLATFAPDGGVAASPRPWDRVAWSNRDTNTRIRDRGAALHLTADLGWATLETTSAVRDWRGVISQDWDFTSADLAYRPDDGSWSNRFRTLTQEVRLSGEHGRLDWSTGLFLADEKLTRRDSLFYGADYEAYVGRLLSRSTANPLGDPAYVSTLTGLPVGQSFVAGQGQLDRYWQTARSAALFAQAAYAVTDRLTLTAGLRRTHETKDMDAAYANTDGGRACAAALGRGVTNATLCLPWSNPAFNGLKSSDTVKDQAWTGLARVEFRAGEATRLYASWSRGRKNGGFNLDRGQTNMIPDVLRSFPAETADAWEVGVKSVLLDRRLLVSAAAFRQTYDDFQLNTFLGTTFLVRSVPEVRAKGVEADFMLTPFEGLSLQGGLTYAQTEYGDDPVPGLPLLAGRRLAFAPLWSGSLAGTYERPVGAGLTGRITLAAKYSSEYNTGSDLDPGKSQPGHWLVDGRVALARDEAWSLELWGRNLFDQDYRQVAFGAPFQSGTLGAFLGAPRTVGVTLRVMR